MTKIVIFGIVGDFGIDGGGVIDNRGDWGSGGDELIFSKVMIGFDNKFNLNKLSAMVLFVSIEIALYV